MRIRSLFATLTLLATISLTGWAQDAVAKSTELLREKKYDEAIKLLEDSYAKKKTPAVKQALADAHVANGNFFMYNESLPPFQKYPNALRQFRKALEYDKENKKATANIATIEGIYKSMGRPVPQ
jgi:tetratricopeptide (TPR) repeat protein